MAEIGERFDYVHPDNPTRKFVVIDPKELDEARAHNFGPLASPGADGTVLLRNLKPKKGSNGVAAVMAHSLPGSFGRGEFVKA